jgi:hypothetical protein
VARSLEITQRYTAEVLEFSGTTCIYPGYPSPTTAFERIISDLLDIGVTLIIPTTIVSIITKGIIVIKFMIGRFCDVISPREFSIKMCSAIL